MQDKQNLPFIDIDDLRIGVFIHLDLGWMSHPFSKSSFRIHSIEQIETLKELGLKRVRWSPTDSDTELIKPHSDLDKPSSKLALTPKDPAFSSEAALALKLALEEQRAAIQACEKSFAHATETCALITDMAARNPVEAAERARTLTSEMVNGITKHPNVCIRLLNEAAGDRASMHAVNVMILSLLLARCLGWGLTDMTEMGIGALLHDIGKLDLNDRFRYRDPSFTAAENRAYDEHVSFGISRARKMGLSSIATLVIAQHHEMSDGSGTPLHLINDRIALASRVVALVNRYDNLCNPHIISQALTPHEAIAHIYAQNSFKFDSVILSAFVKMMGVYPVGSMVQLNDGRFAMVTSVNASRSLRPFVLIHDTKVPRNEALIVDLSQCPELSIRRSVKPLSLPAESMIYLSPRQRVAYFFESSRIPNPEMEAA